MIAGDVWREVFLVLLLGRFRTTARLSTQL
jgi:hypothetical protein